ncbi:MAG: DUF3667 domain-containing protein [Pseudomonadota bacterium]
MTQEIETLGGLAIGGLTFKQDADLSGQPCRNCGKPVIDRYCEHCGQLAASFHRPIWSLLTETLSDTLALDGRLSRTMPLLLFRPGRLTKRYTSGMRARYVPPFRLFLLASLIFFFVVFAVVGNTQWFDDLKLSAGSENSAILVDGEPVSPVFNEDGTVNRESTIEALADGSDLPPEADALTDRTFDIIDDPRLFLAGLEKWAPRLSLLLVPSTIFTLALLHFWRRRLYIYDHSIHALHLHTWLYLTGAAVLLCAPFLGGWFVSIYFILAIIYVCRSLMVAADTNVFMAGIRTLSLLISWFVLVIITTVSVAVLSAIEL